MVSSAIISQKLSMPYSSFAVAFSLSATCSFSSFGIHTIRATPPSAFMNFLEAMKCFPCPINPGVCTPPPVMEASSENVIPIGVIPAYSRFAMQTPFDSGSIPQIHSKHPQDVIGFSMIEYRDTSSRAPWENF